MRIMLLSLALSLCAWVPKAHSSSCKMGNICIEHNEARGWCERLNGVSVSSCPQNSTSQCRGLSGGDYVVGGATAYYYNVKSARMLCDDFKGQFSTSGSVNRGNGTVRELTGRAREKGVGSLKIVKGSDGGFMTILRWGDKELAEGMILELRHEVRIGDVRIYTVFSGSGMDHRFHGCDTLVTVVSPDLVYGKSFTDVQGAYDNIFGAFPCPSSLQVRNGILFGTSYSSDLMNDGEDQAVWSYDYRTNKLAIVSNFKPQSHYENKYASWSAKQVVDDARIAYGEDWQYHMGARINRERHCGMFAQIRQTKRDRYYRMLEKACRP